MTVYLSGPISLGGVLDAAAIQKRIRAFSLEAERLRALGHDVINPCDCEPQESWEAYMRLHIPSVCRSDAVAVLPDWQQSRGATLEVFVATQLGVPVLPSAEITA